MGIYRKFKEDTKMKSKEMTSKEILKKIKEKACKNYCNYICFLNEDETQLARKSQLKAYELIDLYEEISGRNILSDISKIAWDKYYGENEN